MPGSGLTPHFPETTLNSNTALPEAEIRRRARISADVVSRTLWSSAKTPIWAGKAILVSGRSTLILLNAIEGGNRSMLFYQDPYVGAGGVVLKVGQVLYDNDRRYRGRKIEVVRVEGSYAVCMCGPRQVKVRLDYIFSDGKPRRSGYSTVAEDG